MKLLLLAFNARYSHSNPALRYLRNACPDHTVTLMEWSINRSADLIVAEILRQDWDVVGISCYIWNIHLVHQVTAQLKEAAPECLIFLGGPEATSDVVGSLDAGADYILAGEGENSLPIFLNLLAGEGVPQDVPGLIWQEQDLLHRNPLGAAVDLATLSFLYQEEEWPALAGHILYYESSRGCPFACHFCLSATEKLRLRPLELVYQDLDFFFRHEPRQIKFIDRTFNVQPQRTKAILTYLTQHYQPGFHFHLEIEPALLDAETVALLQKMPLGYLQVEAGVQTTNPQVLAQVGRHFAGQKTVQYLKELIEQDNLHVHLDIIAGLPGEDYDSVQHTFDDLHRLYPHYLQLGFLKVLPNTPLQAQAAELGLVYEPAAPYRILSTPWLGEAELKELKAVDGVLNKLYNNGYFVKTLWQGAQCWPGDAYSFYLALAQAGLGHIKKAPRLYDEFLAFLQQHLPGEDWQSLLRQDWYRRFGKDPLPPCCAGGRDSTELMKEYQKEILALRPDLAAIPRHKWHNQVLCTQFQGETRLYALDQPQGIRQPWKIYSLSFTNDRI